MNVTVGKVKVVQMAKAFIETGKDGVLSSKGILSKEEFKDGGVVVTVVLPVSVCHGDLVEVRQQRGDQCVRWWTCEGTGHVRG